MCVDVDKLFAECGEMIPHLGVEHGTIRPYTVKMETQNFTEIYSRVPAKEIAVSPLRALLKAGMPYGIFDEGVTLRSVEVASSKDTFAERMKKLKELEKQKKKERQEAIKNRDKSLGIVRKEDTVVKKANDKVREDEYRVTRMIADVLYSHSNTLCAHLVRHINEARDTHSDTTDGSKRTRASYPIPYVSLEDFLSFLPLSTLLTHTYLSIPFNSSNAVLSDRISFLLQYFPVRVSMENAIVFNLENPLVGMP